MKTKTPVVIGKDIPVAQLYGGSQYLLDYVDEAARAVQGVADLLHSLNPSYLTGEARELAERESHNINESLVVALEIQAKQIHESNAAFRKNLECKAREEYAAARTASKSRGA